MSLSSNSTGGGHASTADSEYQTLLLQPVGTPLCCWLCRVMCNGGDQYVDHHKSRRHKENQRQWVLKFVAAQEKAVELGSDYAVDY